MGSIVLLLFAAVLCMCLIFGQSILTALVFGYVLFFAYGVHLKVSVRKLLQLTLTGIKKVKNVLILFLMIGMITSLWRASGTIPIMIYYAIQFISPSALILLTFLMCCFVSVLTGTAFGTAATIGVICMAIGNSIGLNQVYMGGAILSGVYFGDRCSPMSTSALLVSELTKTNIYSNIKGMIRTSIVPFVVSCGIYYFLGLSAQSNPISPAIGELFKDSFILHPITILPVALIIVLSLFRLNVKITMAISIGIAFLIAWFVQGNYPNQLIGAMLTGYQPTNQELAALLSGGGVTSMLKVFAIVCLSSSYTGIFKETGLLAAPQKVLVSLSKKITPYGSILLTSILAGIVACNQVLTIMLTHQLCENIDPKPERFALSLENTAVVIAPLIPWSVAGAVPLTSVAAPTLSIIAACYLYLLPAWNFIRSYKIYKSEQRGISEKPRQANEQACFTTIEDD